MINLLRNIYMENKAVVPKDEKKEAKPVKSEAKKPKKQVKKGYTMTVERKEVEVKWD